MKPKMFILFLYTKKQYAEMENTNENINKNNRIGGNVYGSVSSIINFADSNA